MGVAVPIKLDLQSLYLYKQVGHSWRTTTLHDLTPLICIISSYSSLHSFSFNHPDFVPSTSQAQTCLQPFTLVALTTSLFFQINAGHTPDILSGLDSNVVFLARRSYGTLRSQLLSQLPLLLYSSPQHLSPPNIRQVLLIYLVYCLCP